jgi:hypothetical protein
MTNSPWSRTALVFTRPALQFFLRDPSLDTFVGRMAETRYYLRETMQTARGGVIADCEL